MPGTIPTEIFTSYGATLGVPFWLIAIALLWSLVWKGFALWKSARLRQPIWFIALLIINTLGILEILYIFLFSEIKLSKKNTKKSRETRSSRKRKRTTRRKNSRKQR